MPVFQYRGFDAKGKPVRGIKDADSPRTLRQNLRREGVLLTDVKEQVMKGERKSAASAGGGIDGESLLAGIIAFLSPGNFLRWLQQRGDASQQVIAILTR